MEEDLNKKPDKANSPLQNCILPITLTVLYTNSLTV